MKWIVALCAFAVLAGCNNQQSSEPTKAPQPIREFEGNDSPIIISDGSTHLQHSGKKHNFQLSTSGGNIVATIDGTSSTWNLSCSGFNACPSGSLPSGWQIVVQDSISNPLITLAPSGSQVNATFTVARGATIDINPSNSKGPTGGTDITHSSTLAKFTVNGTTYNCTSPGSCVLALGN